MDTFTCQKGQGKMSSHTLFKERIYAVSVGDLCWAINHSLSFGSDNCSFCAILTVLETRKMFLQPRSNSSPLEVLEMKNLRTKYLWEGG